MNLRIFDFIVISLYHIGAEGPWQPPRKWSGQSTIFTPFQHGTGDIICSNTISDQHGAQPVDIWYVTVCDGMWVKGRNLEPVYDTSNKSRKVWTKMLRRNWSSCYLSSVACFNVTPGSIIPSKTIQVQMIRFLRCLDALVMPAFLFFVIVPLVELQVQMTYLYSLAATGQKQS